MDGTFVNLDREAARLDRVAVDQAGSLEDKPRLAELDDVVDPDPDLPGDGETIVEDICRVHMLHLPVPRLVGKGQGKAAFLLALLRDGDLVAAVIHVQDTPVSAADVVLEEDGSQHALIYQTDYRTVAQRNCLTFLDDIVRHERIDVLREVLKEPLPVFQEDLALVLVQERILQLQARGREDLHVALSPDLRLVEDDVLARLLLIFKEDKPGRPDSPVHTFLRY